MNEGMQSLDDLELCVGYPGERHSIKEFITPNQVMVREALESIGNDVWDCWDWVCRQIKYPAIRGGRMFDYHATNAFGMKQLKSGGEYFQLPFQTLLVGIGDCLSGDTKIICIEDGQYKAKYLADLEHYGGIQALSYNFDNQRYEVKDIVGFSKKGVKPIWEVTVRNGLSFKCTPNHRFFRLAGNDRKSLHFIERKLSDITVRWNNFIACAREIPELDSVPELLSNELWIEGLYAAEGWNEPNGRVRIGGDSPALKFQAVSNLIQSEVPFSMSKRTKSSSIDILSSPFRKRFQEMGHGAIDKHFIDNRLSCSKQQIISLLDGYTKGDGHLNPSNTTPNSHRVLEYVTISDKLASQLRFLHLILGRPLYSWNTKKPKGKYGNYPNWSLTENTNSAFNKEILPGMSKVSIDHISEAGEDEVYDIEVADNHNFILADSFVIAHNCADKSNVLASLLRNFMDNSSVWVSYGTFSGDQEIDHAWVTARLNGDWHILETTLPQARDWKKVSELPEYMPVLHANDQSVMSKVDLTQLFCGVRVDASRVLANVWKCWQCGE